VTAWRARRDRRADEPGALSVGSRAIRRKLAAHTRPRPVHGELTGSSPVYPVHAPGTCPSFLHRSEAFHSASSPQCAMQTKVPHVVFA
jgi:hypothetical protein